MTADVAAVVLVALTAAFINPFVVLYAFTRPWWRSEIGQALLVSSASLALLVDISLLYQWLGDDYALRDVVRLTVYSLVCLGSFLKLRALLTESRRRDRP